jgi:hypothetical protein
VLTADAMGDVQSERCRVNQVFLQRSVYILSGVIRRQPSCLMCS